MVIGILVYILLKPPPTIFFYMNTIIKITGSGVFV